EVRDFLPVRLDSAGRVAEGQCASADPDDGTTLGDEFVDAVPEGELDESGGLRGFDGFAENPDHLGAGAPGQVEAGDGIAVLAGPGAAAFGPADDRRQLQSEVTQVLALLAGRELE